MLHLYVYINHISKIQSYGALNSFNTNNVTPLECRWFYFWYMSCSACKKHVLHNISAVTKNSNMTFICCFWTVALIRLIQSSSGLDFKLNFWKRGIVVLNTPQRVNDTSRTWTLEQLDRAQFLSNDCEKIKNVLSWHAEWKSEIYCKHLHQQSS